MYSLRSVLLVNRISSIMAITLILFFIDVRPSKGQNPYRILNSTGNIRLNLNNLTSTSPDLQRKTQSPAELPILISFDELIQLRKTYSDSVLLSGSDQLWISQDKLNELIGLFENQIQGEKEIHVIRIEPLLIKPKPLPKIDLKTISMRIQINTNPAEFNPPGYLDE